MKKILKSFLISIFATTSIYAQDLQFNGILSASVSPGFGCYDSCFAGKMIEDCLCAEGTVKFFYDECSAFVDGAIMFDGVANEFDNRLKEAWFDWNRNNNFALRIGRQISAWGKADDLQVTDVLCPQDSTTILASDYADTRLGIDAVRLSFMGDIFSSDFYWIPHFTPDKIPDNKNKPVYDCLFPDGEPDDSIIPDFNIKNSEFALRLNASFSAVDFAFYGFSGWDDTPVIMLEEDLSGSKIVASYKRMWMAGCDAAIPVKDFVFRLEGAYFPQKYYGVTEEFMQDCSYIQRDTIKVLGGIDWSVYPYDITAQYYAETIFGDLEKIENERWCHQVTLNISRKFLNELLEISVSGALHINDLDSTVQVKGSYSVTDNLKIIGQVDLYNSGYDGKDGIYGIYKKLSCGTLKAEFKFN